MPSVPRRAARPLLAAAALVAAAGTSLRAQPASESARRDGTRASACDPDDVRGWRGGEDGFACERRTLALSARAAVEVDAGPNGGVTVRGADSVRAPQVVAIVTARARTDADAARLAAAVDVLDDGGTLRARGPERRGDAGWGDRAWWSVGWRLVVPRRTDLELRTSNGGLRVAGVAGRLRLTSSNGGLTLDSVGGAVVGRSSNGGVRATLAGRAWDAAGLADAGLDLQSSNGGASLHVPADYSAQVSVGTNNGQLSVEFPVTVQGRVDARRLELTLGRGGAPVRVSTHNGGVRLGRVD